MHDNDYKLSSSLRKNATNTNNDPFLELLEICELFEIKNFSILDLEAASRSLDEAIIFTNWPRSLVDDVKKFNLHLRTDLPSLVNNSITPFNWQFDTVDGRIIDYAEEQLFENPMLDGLIMSVRCASGDIFVFVFNGIEEELSNIKLGALLLATVKFIDCQAAHQTTSTKHTKSELTALEVEGLKLQSEGKTKSDISKQWGYTEFTVNTCLASTYKKIGANTCCQAIAIATTTGIIA